MISIHKSSGKMIKVHTDRLSVKDLEYVERVTGNCLAKRKPGFSLDAGKEVERIDCSNDNVVGEEPLERLFKAYVDGVW